jgi:hypothetical protein
MMKKTFDCVMMKHQGAERVQAQLSHLTREQEVEFWRERSQKLHKRQQETQVKQLARSSSEFPGLP